MACYFDARWSGEHGIGRFSREVRCRISAYDIKVGGRPMSPFDGVILGLWARRLKRGDWVFSPGYNSPFFGSAPYVFSIHDINHVDRGDNGGFLKSIYYYFFLRRMCFSSRAILTVSNFSRDRIIDFFGVSPGAVFNVGNGVSEVFSLHGDIIHEGFGYALCVSNRRGHKNELGLIRAFAQALPELPEGRRLLFTGDATAELMDEIRRLDLVERVFFKGRVSEAELAALYRGAEYLVFPSFYEGFGLPIVEAFACGTPVITSNLTSMPEIAGDAALLVNPHDLSDMAAAMIRLDASPELRQSLREKGLERAKQFTWDRVAERVRAAVKAVDTDPERPLAWE